MARKTSAADPDLLAEYELLERHPWQVRQTYRQGTNVVLLEPDVAKAFPTRPR